MDNPLWHAIHDAVVELEKSRVLTRRASTRRNTVIAEIYRAVTAGDFADAAGAPLGAVERRKLAGEKRRAWVDAFLEIAAGTVIYLPLFWVALNRAALTQVSTVAERVLDEGIIKVTLLYSTAAVAGFAAPLLLLAGLQGLFKARGHRPADDATPLMRWLLALWRAGLSGPLAMMQLGLPLALVLVVRAAWAGDRNWLGLAAPMALGCAFGLYAARSVTFDFEAAAKWRRLITPWGSAAAIVVAVVCGAVAWALFGSLSVVRR